MSSRINTTTTTANTTTAGQDNAIVMGQGAFLQTVDSAGVESAFRFAEEAASLNGESFADLVGATEATAKMAMGAVQSTSADSVKAIASSFGASLESVTAAYADAAQPAFDLEAISTKMVPVFVAGFLTLGVIAWAASRKASQ